MLPKLLAEKQRKDGLSNRAASREVGVSHSTISRALNGDQLDMATMEKFADFLGVSVSSLLDMEMSGADGLAAKIDVMVLQKPELAKVFEEAIDLILDDKMDPSVFEDLVAYASFRMSQVK